ncbi:ATP-dependent RNA helicase Ddx1 [Diachasmimorpha longicaudata]|uniref:ATP-dependent RNA helicase Ddx1 n=1 Tax=Diachasmimorpha longicaudata TaxID=58733 RepID=UPI0030B8E230
MAAFEEMGVLPEISEAIQDLEWNLPTDVQAEAIPLILGGGDVLMAAETGSGKTGAFCLPILQTVWENLKDIETGKASGVSSKRARPDLWGLSLVDRGPAMAVTTDGLRCQSREQREWHGCRANKGIQGTGKYYFEAIVMDEGLCRVGWSTSRSSLDLGTDAFGWGYGGTGKKSHARQFDNYGEPFGMRDVIGCLLNLSNGEMRFTKNGVDLGRAFYLNAQQRSQVFFPAVVVKNAEMSVNFGRQPFVSSLPSGFTPLAFAKKDCYEENEMESNSGETQPIKPPANAPQAIIIEPSRELAEQTYTQLEKFGRHLTNPPIRPLLVIGGVPAKVQIAALESGIEIVVGTPGRLEDLIEGGYLSLAHCKFFVLDEADGLLKQGYTKLIDDLHRQIPKITPNGKRLQMIVCSATLHAFEVKKMAERLMHFPIWVDLKGEDVVPETVHHVVVLVDPQADKMCNGSGRRIQTDGVHHRDNTKSKRNTAEALSESVKILKGEYCVRAITEHKMDRALIFCRTKLDCDNLERYLTDIDPHKFSCVCLHGDRKAADRKANLEKFKLQQVKFLICTDVAARGLDISGLPFAINMTLPDEKFNYIHRIGRVGRAERMGLVISLVSAVPEKVWYHGDWCLYRGRNCTNVNLVNQGGCCIWYEERRHLAEIEDHLNITIQHIGSDLKVPMNEYDGKVVYGQKKVDSKTRYENHVQQMAPVVMSLAVLEAKAQIAYVRRHLLPS